MLRLTGYVFRLTGYVFRLTGYVLGSGDQIVYKLHRKILLTAGFLVGHRCRASSWDFIGFIWENYNFVKLKSSVYILFLLALRKAKIMKLEDLRG